MSINDSLDMMPHTVYISSKTSVDSYGKPTFGSRTAYRARVKYGTKMVRKSNGEIVPVTGEMWLATTAILNEDDRYEFIRDESTSPSVFVVLIPAKIEAIPDADGFHHTKIYFE